MHAIPQQPIVSARSTRTLRRRSARRGVALLLVLIIISVGSVLAMGFLQMASNRSVIALSLVDSKKAEFLAESGLTEACYWLYHPELTNGAVWTGVQGRRPDTASTDYYNITVAQSPTNASQYRVTSEAHLMDATGERMVRTIAGDFRMYYGFPDAVTSLYDLQIQPNVTIKGNVYVYNYLQNDGTIDGSVSVGRVFYNSGTVTGLTNLNSPLRYIGSYPVPDSMMYTIGGTQYVAQTIGWDWYNNQTWQSGPTNPMGVRYRRGDLYLYGTTIINGTLVVTGDLHLCAGSNTTIIPKPGFPALVVKDDLWIDDDYVIATINGATIIDNKMRAWGYIPHSRLTINGPLVFTGTYSGFDEDFSLHPKIVVNYEPSRADVSGLYPSQPHTIAAGKLVSYRADGI